MQYGFQGEESQLPFSSSPADTSVCTRLTFQHCPGWSIMLPTWNAGNTEILRQRSFGQFSARQYRSNWLKMDWILRIRSDFCILQSKFLEIFWISLFKDDRSAHDMIYYLRHTSSFPVKEDCMAAKCSPPKKISKDTHLGNTIDSACRSVPLHQYYCQRCLRTRVRSAWWLDYPGWWWFRISNEV